MSCIALFQTFSKFLINYIISQIPFTKTVVPNSDIPVQPFPLLSVGAGGGGARVKSAGAGIRLTNLPQLVL